MSVHMRVSEAYCTPVHNCEGPATRQTLGPPSLHRNTCSASVLHSEHTRDDSLDCTRKTHRAIQSRDLKTLVRQFINVNFKLNLSIAI